MRTTSNFRFLGFTTRTIDPNGKVGWAAVSASESNSSPFAVLRPSKLSPYQLALPIQVLMGLTGSLERATKGASIAWAARNITGTHNNVAHRNWIWRFVVCLLCNIILKIVSGLLSFVN